MKLTRVISTLFVMLMCGVFAQAQSDRTFVSAHGNDNTDCGSSDLPCRTFSFALTKTNAGGEVIALDTGIYDNSTVTISQSVTLAAAPGTHVELCNNLIDGVVVSINAQTSDTVVLRNLYLSKLGIALQTDSSKGIAVTRVGALHVESCVINGFWIGMMCQLSAGGDIFIKDTIARNCFTIGIWFNSDAGLTRASIDHCRLENNGSAKNAIGAGISVDHNARVTIRDSVASGNGTGFRLGAGDLNIEQCEATNNKSDGVSVSGIFNGESGTLTVSNSIVTNNQRYGFFAGSSGTFHSLGNNAVRRNGTNTFGTITVVPST